MRAALYSMSHMLCRFLCGRAAAAVPLRASLTASSSVTDAHSAAQHLRIQVSFLHTHPPHDTSYRQIITFIPIISPLDIDAFASTVAVAVHPI